MFCHFGKRGLICHIALKGNQTSTIRGRRIGSRFLEVVEATADDVDLGTVGCEGLSHHKADAAAAPGDDSDKALDHE